VEEQADAEAEQRKVYYLLMIQHYLYRLLEELVRPQAWQ